MIDFVIMVFLVACLAAFILTILKKWDVIEWLQVHGNEFIHKLAKCDFCLSFWISGILTFILVVVTREQTFVLVPLFSTIISNKLL